MSAMAVLQFPVARNLPCENKAVTNIWQYNNNNNNKEYIKRYNVMMALNRAEERCTKKIICAPRR